MTNGQLPAEQDGEAKLQDGEAKLAPGLPRWLRFVADWIATTAAAIAIVLVVNAFVVSHYRIPSSSMEPTLHCAAGSEGCQARVPDRVLVNRFIYHFASPKRGDIIVFNMPSGTAAHCGSDGMFVKRLIGLPSEIVEVRMIRGVGYVFIDGKKLAEPYVESSNRRLSSEFGPFSVPSNQYFVMGDNREDSCDSRAFGTVPRSNLIGRVFFTYWPPNRLAFH